MDALLFELAGARFALSVTCVREVVRAVHVDPLPHAPCVIAGVINYRGTVIPVIDTRSRLELPAKPVSPEDHFVITEAFGRNLALHIDAPLDLADISPVPLGEVSAELLPHEGHAGYIHGVVPTHDGVLLIQDLPAFLSHDEVALLDRALAAGPQGSGV